MPHIDARSYIFEAQKLQQSGSDADCIAFCLKVMSTMCKNPNIFHALHHSLTNNVERGSRLGTLMNWGFHATNMFDLLGEDGTLSTMERDGVIGQGGQASKEEVRDYLLEAQRVLTMARENKESWSKQ